jgi:hypothetical protein
MSYANGAYWQAQANRCKQFADEGACLARISRHVPVTIVPGFSGLGQTSLGVMTLAARSQQLIAVQRRLIDAGVLSLRAPDGVISATSPTLAALQQWALANGYSATGTARTSSSGLVIPRELFAALISSGTAPRAGGGGATTSDGGGASPGKGGGSPSTPVAAEAGPGSMMAGGLPGWLPWVGAAAAVLVVGAVAMRMRG